MSGAGDDPTLSARLRARTDELAAARIEDLTVAERLTRGALVNVDTFTMDVGTDEDPIEIEVRIPLMVQVDYLTTLQARLETVKSLKDYQKVMAETADILADLCLDPSLDTAFWTSGAFRTETLFGIIRAASEAAADRIKQARGFRPKVKR